MPQHQSRSNLVLDRDEVELLAQLAMVAPLDLFELVQVCLERLLCRKRRAIDALEHRVALVAAPVGAGAREQLDCPDVSRARQVGPLADVNEVALFIERDHRVLNHGVDDFRLVGLAPFLAERDRLGTRHLHPRDRQVAFDDLDRARLDLFQILRRERAVERKVVVKPLVDRRADRHLSGRKQLLHGLGHDVGAGVAVDILPVRRIERDRLQRGVGGQHGGQVPRDTVDLDGQDIAFQRFAAQHVGCRAAGLYRLAGPVWKGDLNRLRTH